MAGLLFEDIFEVLKVDPGGKRFDKGMSHPFSFMGRNSPHLTEATAIQTPACDSQAACSNADE